MKKAIANLKKAIPPKARIAILTVFLAVGVIAYLIISVLFSSSPDDTPADNGMVAVQTNIGANTKIIENPLLSQNNDINTQIQDLKATDINNIKGSDDSKGYFAGVDLNNGTDTNVVENTIVETEQSDVVDLGALFSESPEDASERLANQEKSISDLEAKLEIHQPEIKTNLFDRNAYLNEVKNTISQGHNTVLNWNDIDKVSTLKVNSYATETDNSNESTKGSSISSNPLNTISASSVNQKREKYLARYDAMKTDLESRLSGNSKVVQESQGKGSDSSSKISSEQTTVGESEDYASNKQYSAGEVVYAINSIEIVSDESNVVRVTLAQNGDLYNAILLGSFTQVGDVIGITFNNYAVDGKSYPINAIAIDAETWKSGLADDVDHHYFSRYFGIIAAALVEGYAETLTNRTSVVTDNGTSEGSERIEKVSERFQSAVGKVGEYLTPSLLENVTKQSTVTVYREKGLGIMFMQDFRVPVRN